MGRRIMGVDPGLTNTGVAILNEENKIEYLELITNDKEKDEKRLKKIFCRLNEIISIFPPDVICIERTFVNANPFTSLLLAGARSIVLLVAELRNIPYFEIAPTKVKSTILNDPRASKEDIINYVKSNFCKISTINHNLADAIALAISSIILDEERLEND